MANSPPRPRPPQRPRRKAFDQVGTLAGGGPGDSTVTLAHLVSCIAFRW